MPTKEKKIIIPNSARDTIRRRVRKGASALDAKRSTWRKKVKVDHLQMENGDQCVLGQVYGQYWQGIRKVTGIPEDDCSGKVDQMGISHGFNLGWASDDAVTKAIAEANFPNFNTMTWTRKDAAEADARRIAWDLLKNAWVRELASA